MSAIGDYYIHYWAYNYQNEGIEFREGNPKTYTPTIKDLQLSENYISSKNQNLNKEEREREVKFLQEEYNKMLFGQGVEYESFRQTMRDALNNLLSKAFDTKAGTVNTSNLLQANISSDKIIKASGKLMDKFQKDDKMTAIQLRDLLQEINRWVNIILQEKGTAEQLKQNLNYKQIRSIKRRMTQFFTSIQGFDKYKKLSNQDFNYNSLYNFIQEIKKIDVPLIQSSSIQQGEIGQWVVPWIENFLSIQAKKETSNLVEELQKVAQNNQQGKKGIYIAYSKINGQRYEKTKEEKEKIIKNDIGELKFQYHTSKTDAIFSWTDKKGKIHDEMASIKNYSSFNNLTIVDNTTLASILQASLNPEWTAHYLNVIVAHPDKAGFLNNLKTQAQKSFNKLALYTGLLGYSEKQAPTLFIVFNSSAKQVRIYDPYLLVLKLIDKDSPFGNFSIQSQYGNAKAILSRGDTLTQHWEDSKEKRISNVMSFAHQQKIHMSISLGK